ncbi:hypothetical protein KNV50_gp55 [uncultured phage cr109_1]|uniref:Uncharacterized protein n=1 Tax=uncultured phage cr109_1 TaxID=2772083 RepID=A0A7M1RTN3_9CAUD|nr:hypothetical protein KNV50_gp55 [uncultured phage cr109_1]QOR57049.1 hypothetical protein [uncultured phage cr109_1]
MKKINKRKKYVGGGMTPYMRTDFNSQLPTQLTAPQSVLAYAPGNAKPTSSANFLQSSNFANMFGGSGGSGGGGMAGIGQAGDAINSMISNVTGPATASTVSESRMQTAMGTISGTAKGAATGFAVGGPVGAIVGGVTGLASGIIGKKGSVSVSKNPYDDTVDIKYGTGIRGGARNRRKLRRLAELAQSNARSNLASLLMGSINEQEFYDDYDNDIQTMAQGGMTSSLAYVDDGELLNTPQGVIAEVPEEGKPTDSNLVDLPEGTRILSDKRKVPGSKETFAQMGKRLMSKKKTTRTDKYAENAAMLNEMNNLAIYNKLFTIQESSKKGNTKVNRFASGGELYKGIGEFVTDLTALAPTISNMYARPETFNATYNPYESLIRLTMANRKFDISPAKRSIRENRSISNYNAANYNPSTGANLAYRLLSQIAADKAIADLYSTASNVNNQYAGEYANTLNSLGQQRVNATNMAVDMNARSRAAARNIQRTALTQLSQYAQNKQLMKNQKSRDMAMLDMYGPFLEAGYSSKDLASFMKKFKKG